MAVVSVTASASTALASAIGRTYYEVFNPGPLTVYFDPKGGTPDTTNSMQLLPGGYYERSGGRSCEALTVISTGAQDITVVEG